MSGVINYTRVNFKDYPDKTTPITAANLNKLDKGVYDLDLALKETNDLLGTASQASGVTGATAFAKINKLNSDLEDIPISGNYHSLYYTNLDSDVTINSTDYTLSEDGAVAVILNGDSLATITSMLVYIDLFDSNNNRERLCAAKNSDAYGVIGLCTPKLKAGTKIRVTYSIAASNWTNDASLSVRYFT